MVWRALADAVLAAFIAPPCALCQQVLEHPLKGAVCDRCWSAVVAAPAVLYNSPLVHRASAIGEYDGVLREIIHVLKYEGRRSTARRLAALMREYGHAVLRGADATVPVPLHPKRERERGFNQADDLAAGLALPVRRVLRRTRMTASQVELPASERQRNVRDAFGLADALPGATLVLVDDVTTTGATLEACARVLIAAGAVEVRALTAARVASARRR